jgi:4-hydroxybenzoate polyprenyltransferase
MPFADIGHAVLILPLVLSGAVLSRGGIPETRLLVLILLAAACASTVPMALDLKSGLGGTPSSVSANRTPAYGIALAGAVAFLASAAAISRLCLLLSPIPLAVLLAYPFLRRFTVLSPLAAGVAAALGPAGAWIAVRSTAGISVPVEPAPILLLCGFSALWIAGIGVILPVRKVESGREERPLSLPAILGADKVGAWPAPLAPGAADSLRIGAAILFMAGACLGFIYTSAFAGPYPLLCLVAIAALFLWTYERAEDGKFAFFTVNAIIGALVLAFVTAGVTIPEP